MTTEEREIAELEGVDRRAVHDSIEAARKKLKKFLKNFWKTTPQNAHFLLYSERVNYCVIFFKIVSNISELLSQKYMNLENWILLKSDNKKAV